MALAATVVMGASAFSTLVGCGTPIGTPVGGNQEDPTKANLSVATYDGGVGDEWLQAAARRFEELYKDATHFQEGRTGVKISVLPDKVKYAGSNLAGKSLAEDVYFTESVEYYTFVNDGKIADMTDVITGSLSAYGETGTIADKIDPAFRNYMTAKDDKYYMVPFYDGFYGFIYDVDLFEEEGYYFDDFGDTLKLKDGKNATAAKRAEFEAQKSKGPDNVKGTYDDGLPATYEQFIELCDIISAKNIPFCYSGSYDDYVSKAFRSFIADYEGYEGFSMNYSFSGEAELVKSINPDGTLEMETVTITEDNAYELQRQAGKYYALDMQEKLFGSVKYIGNTYNSFDFTAAQAEFIKSKYGTKRYAMLLDGVWWENEADSVFTELETIRGESKSDRRFAFMPIPKATAAVGDEARPQTMFSANSSFGFISKNAANMELAKEFMRFLHTDSEMSKFSATTSIPRALNYEVKEEDMATATHFGKSLLEMKMNAKVVYPYSSLSLVINNSAAFTEGMWYLTASVGGATLNNPFTAFKNGTTTAAEYFNGLYTYQKSAWNNLRR